LTVEVEGEVCAACQPTYVLAADTAEDAYTQEMARGEWGQMLTGGYRVSGAGRRA
jgi:hypothetical protein